MSSTRASDAPSRSRPSSGNPGERKAVAVVGVAHPEQEGQPFGPHPSGHEGQDLRRSLIQPLRVVDETQQRLFFGDLGQQVEDGQPDQEPVRCGASVESERHPKGGPLRLGQRAGAFQQGSTQLVQPSERELRLGLDAGQGLQPEIRGECRLVIVLEQGGLPDAGFSTHHERAAAPEASQREELLDRLTL
ncbi:hypothetical protein O7607_00490 [Micromonospora sp. WMMA1949]|nr:hypothetical protein [Micromonospora sp. WMMA1949]MCZ7424197.1 hypothetical protein [Micromonospora sp. WMMA1949]